MKDDKASGLEGNRVDLLKHSEERIIKWVLNIFKRRIKEGAVPENWKVACIIPAFTGRGNRSECANYREILIQSNYL